MKSILKSKKLQLMIAFTLLLSMVLMPRVAMANANNEAMTLQMTFPDEDATFDNPVEVHLSEGQNMLMAFRYTGNPTHYGYFLTDESGKTLHSDFQTIADNGGQTVFFPELPKNIKIKIGLYILNIYTGESVSAPYRWFILR